MDARRCISYLTIEHDGPIPAELRPLIGNRLYGCDDCQLACPWNKYAQTATLADFDARPELAAGDLLGLWAWSEAEFLRRTEGSAIRRIGHGRWQRNLAVVSGNALRRRDWPALRERLQQVPRRRQRAAGRAPGLGTGAGPRQTRQRRTSSHSGRLTMPSSVDRVTSPATRGPLPPMRTAST